MEKFGTYRKAVFPIKTRSINDVCKSTKFSGKQVLPSKLDLDASKFQAWLPKAVVICCSEMLDWALSNLFELKISLSMVEWLEWMTFKGPSNPKCPEVLCSDVMGGKAVRKPVKLIGYYLTNGKLLFSVSILFWVRSWLAYV